jgi:acetyl esterase/lipase
MHRRHIKIAASTTAIALLGYGFYTWLNLPYRRFPLENSAQPSVSNAAPNPGAAATLRPTFADVAYANQSPFQKLDLYLPAQRGIAAPLVIWIHGGGFSRGDKRSMPRRDFGPPPKTIGPNGPYQIQVPDVSALTKKGYAVASLNYRLGWMMLTDAAAAIRDGKAAVRFLRANSTRYGLDPGRFAAWGNSAGGYMAAMLGATGDQPTTFDVDALGNAGVSSAVQAVVVWFGAEDRLPGQDLSIQRYISSAKTLPPFMIANGDMDPVISPAQAKRLQDALTQAGAKSSLTILRGAGHEDPQFMQTQMMPTFDFLDRTFGRSP